MQRQSPRPGDEAGACSLRPAPPPGGYGTKSSYEQAPSGKQQARPGISRIALDPPRGEVAADELSTFALLPPSGGVAAADLSSLLPRFALLSPSGGVAAVELSRSVYFWIRIRLRPHELGEGDTEYLLDIDFEIVLRFDSDPSSLLDAILVVVQTQSSEEADVTEDAALKLHD